MRKVLISSALILSLAGASGAMAATKPAATKPAATKAATPATPAQKAKMADCVKQWKAEKKHTETRKAFLKACTEKA
jgi:hypothetical protein